MMIDIDCIYPDRPEVLGEMEYSALRQLMFDVLHGTQVLGPPLDPRSGIRPFEQLSEVCLRGDRVVRRRIAQVIREFLYELVDIEAWPEDARGDLLDFVQDCGDEVVEDLRTLVRQKTLLDAAAIGPPGHAGLLKCMLSLGAYSTPAWWLEQFDLLGPDYGALMFSGLVEHGLDHATGQLPKLCASDLAAREIAMLIPGLVDQYGLDRVQEAFAKEVPSLSDTAADGIMSGFGCFQAEELAALVGGLLNANTVGISDPEQFQRAIFASLHRLVIELVPPWLRLSGDVPADQVLSHLAGLALTTAPLISGDQAPSILWEVCSTLLRALSGQQLVVDTDVPSEFYEVCRKDGMTLQDAKEFLRKSSRRSTELARRTPRRRSPDR